MGTVYGVSAQSEGVVAEGGPNSPGLRAAGFYGVEATGTNVGASCRGPVGVAAYGDRFGVIATGKVAAVEAEGATGVRGNGTAGPGGAFSRDEIPEGLALPQVHIKPQPMWVPDSVGLGTVRVLPANDVQNLPWSGEAGDLLVTVQTVAKDARNVPPRAEAMLWLCVVSAGSQNEPAVWKQVLLGPSVEGRLRFKG